MPVPLADDPLPLESESAFPLESVPFLDEPEAPFAFVAPSAFGEEPGEAAAFAEPLGEAFGDAAEAVFGEGFGAGFGDAFGEGFGEAFGVGFGVGLGDDFGVGFGVGCARSVRVFVCFTKAFSFYRISNG